MVKSRVFYSCAQSFYLCDRHFTCPNEDRWDLPRMTTDDNRIGPPVAPEPRAQVHTAKKRLATSVEVHERTAHSLDGPLEYRNS